MRLYVLVFKTELGRSLRAVSQDRVAALTMGIDADRINARFRPGNDVRADKRELKDDRREMREDKRDLRDDRDDRRENRDHN